MFLSASMDGMELVCADAKSRICYPIACARLADCLEKMTFLGLTLNGSSYC